MNSLKLKFDFIGIWAHHQKQKYILKRQPLARALGLPRNSRVLDATCGTGKDSLLILSFGACVQAFERNSFISRLLMTAIEEGKKDTVLGPVLHERFVFREGDCRFSPLMPFDVIYYDPMYAEKRKALPRKEMQFFQKIVGEDEDREEFFKWGIKKTSRLVLKRPLKGSFLFGRPQIIYRGSKTRYDVYLKKGN